MDVCGGGGGFKIENFTDLRAFCGLEHYQRFGFCLNVVTAKCTVWEMVL